MQQSELCSYKISSIPKFSKVEACAPIEMCLIDQKHTVQVHKNLCFTISVEI